MPRTHKWTRGHILWEFRKKNCLKNDRLNSKSYFKQKPQYTMQENSWMAEKSKRKFEYFGVCAHAWNSL